MKTYLLDTFNRYKRYSEKLDAKTVLCNKCWWVFNDAGEKETYIFKEDGNIIISVSGAVTYGKWEYLPVNKSIIISGNNQSFMVLPSFVDEYILALQVDGTNNFAFLIDEQNKAKFNPTTYKDVVGYFEEKERKAIALQKQQEEERIKKEQEKFITKLRIKRIVFLCFSFVINFFIYSIPFGFIIERLDSVSDFFQIILGLIYMGAILCTVAITTESYVKDEIKVYIQKHPNDPMNPFFKEHL